jgi:hypothetical protein
MEIVSVDLPKGSSGDQFYLGSIWNRADPVADMRGQGGTEILDRMRLDAELGAGLGHIKYPIRAGNWNVASAEEGNAEEDEIAEECREMLMPGATHGFSGTSTTWDERLVHAMTMFDFGFSVFEKVWGKTSDGKQTIASLEPMLAPTIFKWNYFPSGEFAGATQRAFWPDGHFDTVDLEAFRLVPCVFNREGKSHWGRALIRNAYLSWYAKKLLIVLDGIIKERFGGVPTAEDLPGRTPTPEEIAELKKVIANFRIHHEQSLYAGGFKITLQFPSGANCNLLESVQYHDSQMAQIVLSEMIKMGQQGAGGNRALGDTKADLLFIALSGICKPIEDSFTQHVVIPFVRARHGIRKKYPRVVAPDFAKMRNGELLPLIKQMVDARVIMPDDRLEEYVREQLELPEADPTTAREAPLPFGGGDPRDPEAKAGPAKKLSQTRARRRRPQPKQLSEPVAGRFRRELYAHEQNVDFSGHMDYLDQEPLRAWGRLVQPVRRDLIRTIARAAARASDVQLSKGAFSSPSSKPLADKLASAMLGSYARGRRSVLEEARRQGAGIPKNFCFQDDDELEAELEELGATAAQTGWIRNIATSIAVSMLGALLLRAKDVGMAGREKKPFVVAEAEAEVKTALEKLSLPVQMANLAGGIMRAFTIGRVEQGLAMAPQITSAFYSAMMDGGTCMVCAALDGAEFEIGDPTYQTPNPDCDGGVDRCRCVPIYVFQPSEAMQEAA